MGFIDNTIKKTQDSDVLVQQKNYNRFSMIQFSVAALTSPPSSLLGGTKEQIILSTLFSLKFVIYKP